MFRRILLAWPEDAPPQRSLEFARTLADSYEAELIVCCLGDGAIEAQAAVVDARVETLPKRHAEREILHYAHGHGFDLLVVGRLDNAGFIREVLERASLPVLVVAEASTLRIE
jgi:hypothetical protein